MWILTDFQKHAKNSNFVRKYRPQGLYLNLLWKRRFANENRKVIIKPISSLENFSWSWKLILTNLTYVDFHSCAMSTVSNREKNERIRINTTQLPQAVSHKLYVYHQLLITLHFVGKKTLDVHKRYTLQANTSFQSLLKFFHWYDMG